MSRRTRNSPDCNVGVRDRAGGTTSARARTLRVRASDDAKPVQSKVTKREVLSLGAAAAVGLGFTDRCEQQPP
jgi:hypothetical protein